MEDEQVAYDDVMLDWAVAELMSPMWTTAFTGAACDGLRAKIQRQGVEALSEYEQTWLIGYIVAFRSPIISVYGPFRTWSFRRTAISREELARFAIIHHFGYPSFSFGDLAAKIRDDPANAGEQELRESVRAIQQSGGERPLGCPIAVERQSPKPSILIEGYKRSMAALWSNESAPIEMYLCDPRPTSHVVC